MAGPGQSGPAGHRIVGGSGTVDPSMGKELWEIGLFRHIEESQAAYRELQRKGYVRYENLSLESRSGQKVEVEFVRNVYVENHTRSFNATSVTSPNAVGCSV